MVVGGENNFVLDVLLDVSMRHPHRDVKYDVAHES